MKKKLNGGPTLFLKNGGRGYDPTDRPGGPLISYYAKKGGKLPQANFTDYTGSQMYGKGGEMIKRKDGSYSQRGLWDNIRANKGSGKKPTKEMLKQEAKIENSYGNGGPTDLFRTDKRAFVDSALNANKNLDFVQRLYNPNPVSIQIPGEKGRSTHFMANDPGSMRVYPEVVRKKGQSGLTHLMGDDAWNYADSTKEFISFNSPEKAEWFANSPNNTTGYKMGTGVLHSIAPVKKLHGGPLLVENQHVAMGGSLKAMYDQGGALNVAYGQGGGIHIKPENKGKFTAWAKSHNMGVQEAASHVMANKEDYSSTIVKRANFAKNAAGWKHAFGGKVNPYRLNIAGQGLKMYGPGGPFDNQGEGIDLGQQTLFSEYTQNRNMQSGLTDEQLKQLGIFQLDPKQSTRLPVGDIMIEDKKPTFDPGNLYSGVIQAGSSLVGNMAQKNQLKAKGSHDDGSADDVIGAAKGMGKGAAMGAKIGSVIPGVGTAIGAGAGAVIGGVAGYFQGKKTGAEKKKNEAGWQANYMKTEQNRINANSSRYQDFKPTNSGYYANGGSLAKNFMAQQKAVGGNLVPLSSDAVEVKGPSHANGGVQLPEMGAEVEGKEVIKDDYVFSDQLGFAKEAKRLAKAKGTIENKPATRERINTLKLLQDKENQLKLAQEYIRKQYNLA